MQNNYVYNNCPWVRSRYLSESTPRRLHDDFCPICIQVLSRRHLLDVSNLRVERKEAKGSSKMATGPANQNCSFDSKWQPQYGGCQFEKPFQSIRVVLLIANGGLPWRPPFSRQNSVKSREATHISP